MPSIKSVYTNGQKGHQAPIATVCNGVTVAVHVSWSIMANEVATPEMTCEHQRLHQCHFTSQCMTVLFPELM